MLIKINERPNTTNITANVAMKESILTKFRLKRYMVIICSDKFKSHKHKLIDYIIRNQKKMTKQKSQRCLSVSTKKERQKDVKNHYYKA